MKKILQNLPSGILAGLLVCFLASCQGPQGAPGTDGRDVIVQDTAWAVKTAVAGKTGGGDDPWTVRVSGVDISDPNVYRHIISGIAAAIEEGDIALDLSGCTGETFVYADGVNRADKLRIVAITLPDSLTHLVDGPAFSTGQEGAGAFHGYTRLGSVSAPGLIYIGDYAFYSGGQVYDDENHSSNEALSEVYFPEVLSVGAYAFAYCTNLSSIRLPKAVSIGDYAFAGNQYYLLLTEVNLPEALSIGANAFENWRTIASITLPKVTTIGDYAFSAPLVSNEVLLTLYLPRVETIGNHAFVNYSNLATITLPEIRTIGNSAFGGVSSTTNTALVTLDLRTVTSIGTAAFRNCTALNSLKLGPVVPSLPDLSTAAGSGIFVLAAAGSGTIDIQIPAAQQSAYDTAGWKAVPQGDNTQADTIRFGTNHKAITISTY